MMTQNVIDLWEDFQAKVVLTGNTKNQLENLLNLAFMEGKLEGMKEIMATEEKFKERNQNGNDESLSKSPDEETK